MELLSRGVITLLRMRSTGFLEDVSKASFEMNLRNAGITGKESRCEDVW